MGWLWLALIGIGAAFVLWRAGVARELWAFAGAALMLGAAGYAWQGHPFLAGDSVKPDTQPFEVDPATTDLRDAMFGRFTADWSYLMAGDGMLRAGDARAAILWILGGINHFPNSAALWTGLGSAYAQHDGNIVSPEALFAFHRAMQLAPKHPGPPFFLGLAYVRAGQYSQALPYWRRALALTPPAVSYRKPIALRLMLLERYAAQLDAMQAAEAAGQ